jgi:hypothetical protein
MNRIEIELANHCRLNNLIALASHFLKFLSQPAFGTFTKPHNPTHHQSFAKEPNFANALKQIITLKEYNYGR